MSYKIIRFVLDTGLALNERENPSLILPLPKGEEEKDRVDNTFSLFETWFDKGENKALVQTQRSRTSIAVSANLGSSVKITKFSF